MTYGQGESLVAERIETWENELPNYIKLAYLPSPGRVRLRLTARGTDREVLEEAIQKNVKSLAAIIGDIIVGFEEDETLEVGIGKLLSERHQTVATVESCSGGKIAQMITANAGASAYFKGSVVCYSQEVKINVLGIDADLILKYGVVSAEVALAMAQSVRQLLNSDYAIATTGNAGPSKEEGKAEVGEAFVAIVGPEGLVVVEGFQFGQPREKVIDRVATKALEMLRNEILKKGL
jgi:nicotinamide-nucleotide amidase